MSRVIDPKRDPATGDLYHFCPHSAGERCYSTLPQACAEAGGSIEWLLSRYRVHCNALDADPVEEFEPPKAHDSLGRFKGPETVNSPSHTWVEPKLDGVRALVHVLDGEVHILSRRKNKEGQFNRMTANFPQIRDNPTLRSLRGYWVLDGELIMPADFGVATLPLTMSVVGALPERAIATQREKGFAILNLFDIVRRGTQDLLELPLSERRHILDRSALEGEFVRLVPHHDAPSPAFKTDLAGLFVEQGLEGAVIKDPSSRYLDSRAWLKVKQTWTVDALVTGFDWGTDQGKYAGTIGALRCSVIDAATKKLHEICAVNPGDDATRARLLQLFREYDGTNLGHFQMVVELRGQLLTEDGRIRHPRVVRFRPDRSTPNTVNFATRQVVG